MPIYPAQSGLQRNVVYPLSQMGTYYNTLMTPAPLDGSIMDIRSRERSVLLHLLPLSCSGLPDSCYAHGRFAVSAAASQGATSLRHSLRAPGTILTTPCADQVIVDLHLTLHESTSSRSRDRRDTSPPFPPRRRQTQAWPRPRPPAARASPAGPLAQVARRALASP